jgi:hypothetical protein
MIDLRDVSALTVTLPFLEAETLDIMAIMESDFWRHQGGLSTLLPHVSAVSVSSEEGSYPR